MLLPYLGGWGWKVKGERYATDVDKEFNYYTIVTKNNLVGQGWLFLVVSNYTEMINYSCKICIITTFIWYEMRFRAKNKLLKVDCTNHTRIHTVRGNMFHVILISSFVLNLSSLAKTVELLILKTADVFVQLSK